MYIKSLLSLLVASCQEHCPTIQDIKAWAQQESILTTQFRLKKDFEWALSQGYRPSPEDLALVIATCPEDIKLIRRLIEDYEINPAFVDEAGNNLLGIISLKQEATATILYLLQKCHLNPHHSNNAGVSFFDKFSKTRYFTGKEEILALLQSRQLIPHNRTVEPDIMIEVSTQPSKKK